MFKFYGQYDVFKAFMINKTGVNLPDWMVWGVFVPATKGEFAANFLFAAGLTKCVVYPVTLVLQILSLIFLVRGNSGYSRSAKNWFIMAVSADIFSFLYLTYETITQDWIKSNPYDESNTGPSYSLLLLMWSLRDATHADIQNAMCKTFFTILYFPLYLSPICLTVSSLVRSYCVKYPLRAKAVLTKKTDRVLMACVLALSLAVAVIIGVINTYGDYDLDNSDTVLGVQVFVGKCMVPLGQISGFMTPLLQGGYLFMMVFGMLLSGLNMLSAGITVWVLFDARKTRKAMSTTVGENSSSEIRATMKLLGINIVIFICFFLSRMFIFLQFYAPSAAPFGSSYLVIIQPILFERLGSYLFVIPYCINWMFIVGFDKRFYAFFFGCIQRQQKSKYASSMHTKSASEFQ